jgi:hypothetical protein
MNRRDFDIDHIDPRWKEGRDYQLVCGLDCPLNFRESDPSFNVSKSNRFLPWRWCRDEIGVVPEEEGDLAYFLVGADIQKDTPGEWVLMEFLSEEWFEITKYTHGSAANDNGGKLVQWRKGNPDPAAEWRKQNPEKTFEIASRAGKKRAASTNAIKYRCTITGFISTPGPLTGYQKKRGIDPSNRIRIN